MAENHGENKTNISGMMSSLENIKEKLRDVADGKTQHIGEINARLDNHEDQLESLWEKTAKTAECGSRHEDLRRLLAPKDPQ